MYVSALCSRDIDTHIQAWEKAWCLSAVVFEKASTHLAPPARHSHRAVTKELRRTNQNVCDCENCGCATADVCGSSDMLWVVWPDARNSRALRAGVFISGLQGHWRRLHGWPRQSWTWTIEEDLSALSIGLHTAWKRTQDREQWQWTVEEAMLQHGACPWWRWW